MLLSAQKIRQLVLLNEGDLRDRLVITPILNWDTQAKSGNCSIDVRLGQKFTIPLRAKLTMLDHMAGDHQSTTTRYKDEHYVPVGDHFVLHPQQFVLGETLEWVHMPRGFAAYVIGRSAWGRDGLIIATAIGVHAGYSGVLTLEIANVGEIPILLYPGLRIAQLFIHEVQHLSEERLLQRSAFSGSTHPSSGSAAGEDREIISYIRDLRRRQQTAE